MLSYGRQCIDEKDIKAVTDVLRSDFLTQGPAVERFEKYVAWSYGSKYAVAVNSATSALHIACMAAGLKAGDVLWTSPNTFVASANCALYCGADVDFVDIDDKTYNMDVDLLEKKLETSDKKPKIVVPVHFSGQSCDMERISQLAKKYGFMVMEDASHAVGATYKESKVGSCQYSDMTVFSFHPVKIATSAEGGMVLTNSKELYDRLLLFRSHGITRNADFMTKESDGPWYYEQIDLGYNYRMTDVLAALGQSQMEKVDIFVKRRRDLAARYGKLLADMPLRLPFQEEYGNSSWHIYVVRVDFSKVKLTKKEIFEKMKAQDIALNLHYIPVHTQPYYAGMGFKKGDFPISEKYYEEVMTLPLYYGLTDNEQEYVAEKLKEVLASG